MLRLAASLLLLASSVLAQNSQIPGSGCAQAPFTAAAAARVGQPFTWSCPVCLGTAVHFAVLGVRLSIFFPLQPPVTCRGAGTCFVACDPLVVVRGASSGFTIPSDPRLVGACLCVQCACYDLNFACLSVMGAIEACVQP